MKKFNLLCLCVFVVLVCETGAFGGVIGSPHDIAAQRYSVAGKEPETNNACNYCHVPHRAKGVMLWAIPPPSLKGWGRVGPLCYSCHDGVSIVSPYVDASQTAFSPKSHGLLLSNLPSGDDVSASGLPYTNGAQPNIECSTCHNPHDNTIRPFLRVALIDLCEKCHKNRENSGYGINNVEGTHPVHNIPKDLTEGPSPIYVIDDFKVPFPHPYPAQDGRDTDGVHWTLGGHLSKGNDGTMECTTCHSVHGKQPTGPVESLLSVDPVKDVADVFCEGCHRGVRADGQQSPPYPNPGGTTAPRSYHPADNDLCNGPGRIVAINQPTGWVFGKAGEVLCTTCHEAHGAIKDAPILRTSSSETFCESCHSTPFAHHPVGPISSNNINSGNPHAVTRQVVIPPNFPVGITYGNPVSGVIYCSTCHKAHNANCPPVLVIDCANGDSCSICTMCHPKFNPTWQTDDNWKATHFLGDPTQAVIDHVVLNGTIGGTVYGTQPGYYDLYPPTHTGKWPESGLISGYGGANGQEITCCSCHNFNAGNITAGNADDSPYLGPVLAPGYQPSDLVSGLLARAGDFKEWLPSDLRVIVTEGDRGTMSIVDKYLCTGCHGLTPNSHPVGGEGWTHPMMDADGGTLKSLDTPATLTFNKHVNCESCHSVHESDSTGGFLILKTAQFKQGQFQSALPDPYSIVTRKQIEFAPLCQLCHIGY